MINDRVIRLVNRSGLENLAVFLDSNTAQKFSATGHLVRTELLDERVLPALGLTSALQASGLITHPAMILEHERITFPSFPYEWAPEMLHAAARLTLDLAESLLAEGLGLKDATPYNILFRGAQPVFIDFLSFEARPPNDPTWLPCAQFIRTFILPLLVNQHFGLPLSQSLLTNRDGLEPEAVYALCRPLQRLRPPFLGLVSLPTWLAAQQNPTDETLFERKETGNSEKARFILQHLLNRIRRVLKRVTPKAERSSAWSDYQISQQESGSAYLAGKQAFVETALRECRPRRVLDVGCNTGHFSQLAARPGAEVVAIDSDPVVVGQLWRQAQATSLNILPLVIDLSRPSPSVGWRNRECPSFLDRAAGTFDLVLMLAVVHHLLVSERIPLAEIIELAAQLSTRWVLLEYVAPEDPLFRRLTRGRGELFTDFTREKFEAACRRHFVIVQARQMDSATRWLYLLRKE